MLLVVLVGNKGIINVHHPGRSHEFCYSCALGPDFRYCNQRGRRLRWSCEGMLSTKIRMTIVLIPSLPSKLNKGKWVLLSLSLRNNNNHYLMSVFFNCQALSNVHFLHFLYIFCPHNQVSWDSFASPSCGCQKVHVQRCPTLTRVSQPVHSSMGSLSHTILKPCFLPLPHPFSAVGPVDSIEQKPIQAFCFHEGTARWCFSLAVIFPLSLDTWLHNTWKYYISFPLQEIMLH